MFVTTTHTDATKEVKKPNNIKWSQKKEDGLFKMTSEKTEVDKQAMRMCHW